MDLWERWQLLWNGLRQPQSDAQPITEPSKDWSAGVVHPTPVALMRPAAGDYDDLLVVVLSAEQFHDDNRPYKTDLRNSGYN